MTQTGNASATPGTSGGQAGPGERLRSLASSLLVILALVVLSWMLCEATTAASGAVSWSGADTDAPGLPSVSVAHTLVQTRTTVLPAVYKAYLDNPDNPFGVQIYTPSPDYLAAIGQVGAGMIRIPLIWAAIEPANTTPANYAWDSYYEQALALMAARGLDIILTIQGNPSWAATYYGGPIDRVPLTEFTQFVQAVVRRYGAPPYNIRMWEFYNEPENGDVLYAEQGWGYWGNEPEAYVDMLAAVYQPIKQVDPQALVLIGGLAYDWWPSDGGPFVREFLDGVLQAGGGAYFDLMNFHYYPTAFAHKWIAYGPGLVGKTNFLRDKLASYGLNKPIICTEAGVESKSTVPGVGDETQSRWVPRIYAETMAAGLMNTTWFMLTDEPGLSYWKTGLLNADLTPKPAYFAYQTAVWQLSQARYLGTLTVDETGSAAMEAFAFLAPNIGRRFTLAWTNDELIHPLAFTATQVMVIDKFGAKSRVYDGDDGTADGQTHVPIGPSPVYLHPGQ